LTFLYNVSNAFPCKAVECDLQEVETREEHNDPGNTRCISWKAMDRQLHQGAPMIVIRRGRARNDARRSTDNDEIFRALVFSGAAITSSQRGVWRPPTEVYETETALEVVAEIAGMEREQIEILISSEVMSVRGVRPDPAVCDRRSYHEARISYGHFAAEIFFPFPVEVEQASATYENGFLRVSVPKLVEPSRTLVPRRIDSE
jgi:HSP20 family protein